MATAWEVVRLADRANAGIAVDAWHWFRGTPDEAALRTVPGVKILAVQLGVRPRRVRRGDPRAATPDVVETTRTQRAGLMVWAAANRRATAVTLLAELGFDVNARARGDVPIEQPWETALHQAVANGDRPMVELLLSLGADPDVHDQRFDATPLGWAHHFDQPDLVQLLEPVTTATQEE